MCAPAKCPSATCARHRQPGCVGERGADDRRADAALARELGAVQARGEMALLLGEADQVLTVFGLADRAMHRGYPHVVRRSTPRRDSCASPAVTAASPEVEALRRRGLALAYFIVGWDVIEGAIAVTAGFAAGSIALVGFGIDSGIEVVAASVVIWQLRGGAHARQRTALRLIAVTFFVLAAYVGFEGARDLVTSDKAGESIVGIVLNVVALAVMVPVAVAQKATGRDLGNPVLVAQGQQTWLSNYLSISLLVGLSLNALFGWWWADPVVALLIAGIAIHEGREALERSTARTD